MASRNESHYTTFLKTTPQTGLAIINAPSSTKNADKARDPEMHQTKNGNQWYFGMKAHFEVETMPYSPAATKGRNTWAMLASLIETCKLHSVNPKAYLTDVLTRLVNG
jgi:hypothetical protein